MNFNIRLENVTAPQRGSDGIIFELTLENPHDRTATILSCEFQLWLVRPKTGEALFLGPLLPEYYGGFDFRLQFDPRAQTRIKVSWHYDHQQLQQIEDWRGDHEPSFQIRGRTSVVSVWPGEGGKPQPPQFSGECFFSNNAYPVSFSVSLVRWTELLEQLGFNHVVLYQFPLPQLPPGFSRSEAHLKEAWEHHRAGRRDEALLSCRKVFEPLGFNLYGEVGLKRDEVLSRIMTEASDEKRSEILKLWQSLQNLFSNVGIHERGKPIELTKADTELAVICTTAILGYLAKQI